MNNGSALVLLFYQNLIVPEILILNGNRHTAKLALLNRLAYLNTGTMSL